MIYQPQAHKNDIVYLALLGDYLGTQVCIVCVDVRASYMCMLIITAKFTTLTEALGSLMVFVNARASFVADLMVSVLPYLNVRVAALSYVAVSLPYSLRDDENL